MTVIAGFLGAGKSTLLEKALRNRDEVGGRLALIVNDVADLNIDADLLRGSEVRYVIIVNHPRRGAWPVGPAATEPRLLPLAVD